MKNLESRRRLTSNSWVQLWNEQLLTPASAALAMSWRLAPASHKPQKTALEVERERERQTQVVSLEIGSRTANTAVVAARMSFAYVLY